MTPLRVLLPAGWPEPRGYAHGLAGRGQTIFVGGMVGADEQGRFAEGFVAQAAQALRNVVAVLREAGATPQHIARMVWYLVDMDDYRNSLRDLAGVYRGVMGRHFPAMTVIEVQRLVEPEARIEIEATALLPD